MYAESPTTGWGESKYDDLVRETGYDKGTLKVYASIARRFNSKFRENVLIQINEFNSISFAHFQLVAPLDDTRAEYWLKKAAESEWGVAKLREELNRGKDGSGRAESEVSETYQSFKECGKNFFKDFTPSMRSGIYDETSWLLEVKEVIEERLEELGVIDG